MKIEQYQPCEVLKPFVKTFTFIESEDGMQNRILPDTSIVMAFRFRGSLSYADDETRNSLPAGAITGLRRSFRLVNYSGSSATLLVLFKEGGAAAFFNQPLHELFQTTLSLGDLIPSQRLADIEEQLSESKSNVERLGVVEKFLLSLLKEAPSTDPLVIHAIEKIKSVKGNIRVKELAADLHISQDRFEKRFRQFIGSSAKQFATIVRIRCLINGYPASGNLTNAAHAAGYFDQAHFIKDFRSFTGQAPLNFFRSGRYW